MDTGGGWVGAPGYRRIRDSVRAWIQEEAGWVRQDTGGYGIPLEHGYRRRLGGCARIQEDTGFR